MSTYYYFYAEVKNNGKWIGLSPIVKSHDGKYKIQPLMWGQSAMYELYEDMIDTCSACCGLPEDVSAELLEEFHAHDEKTTDFWGNKEITWGEYYKTCVHSVNYDEAVRKKIKRDRPYKYQGYVHKRLIAAFEVGEIEDLQCWLTIDEYKELPDNEKKEYAWYEWNEYCGEYGFRFELYQKIENLLDWYREEAFSSKSEYNYEDFIGANVRLIIHRS